MLVGGVARCAALDRLGDALLGVAQDLRSLRGPIADVPGRDLLGQRLGPRRDLFVELARIVRSAHTPPYPARRQGYTAESAVHWSHDSVQSQRSPSRADSLTGVPLTSTGSP